MRTFYPEVRLKKLMAAAGGITVNLAIERAVDRVEALRDDALGLISAKIERVAVLTRLDDDASRKDAYSCANELFGEAGAFGWRELSQAARSLCRVLAAPSNAKTVIMIELHVQTLRALARPELAGDTYARIAVLKALEDLSEK